MIRACTVLIVGLVCCCRGAAAQTPARLPAAGIEHRVRDRIASQPNDAAAWRMLGRLLLERGDAPEAAAALDRSVQLDSESAAAHADLAAALHALGNREGALLHWRQAIAMAPDSDYASEARQRLRAAGESDAAVLAASFTPTWRDAPLPEPAQVAPAQETLASWSTRFDLGAHYNSNVALSPISRELSSQARGGFQVYAAPELEYRRALNEDWDGGALLESFAGFNEAEFDDLNLFHVQPGLFVERWWEGDGVRVVPRAQYDFAFDTYAEATLGTRHALTGSLATYRDAGPTWLGYASLDYTDFRDDGADPSVDSSDGWTTTLGLSRETEPAGWWLTLLRLGADVEWAALEGSSYRYLGVSLYAAAHAPLVWGCELRLDGGWGYRDYCDFAFSPSRNEHVWSAGVELRRPIAALWSVSGAFHYDRFASRNDEFDAERYTAGIFATWER
jgi:hypothetical protein